LSISNHIMKKALLLSAGLLSIGLVFAQKQAATPHTLLWKVAGKGLKKPSYLFGTMHVLCADQARLSDSLKAVIAACDEVYFEIKLDDLSNLLGAVKYMMMNDDKRLSDLLSPVDYQKVKDYFVKHASLLPFSMLERFKPLLISSLIEEENMNCQATDGMELTIMKEVHPYNKPILGLETVEFQAALFDSIPYADQAKELLAYIDSAAEYKKMTLELADVYKKQDLDQIDELSRKGDPGMDAYMDLLLYGRNRKWARILDTVMSGHSFLIAVGAAHLPGNGGLIDLLKKEGYELTPVKN
jgi:uncharacterized protein YbaP (TraB family)